MAEFDLIQPIPAAEQGSSEHANASAEASAGREQWKTQRILQFTDLHLFTEPDRRLGGQCTRDSFEAVLALAQGTGWPPDAILFTGDLVHDERPEAYRYLRQRIDRLGCPCYCIPGNHDRADLLAREVEPGADQDFRVKRLGAWDLILLDSTLPGSEAGRLQLNSLAALERHLQSAHPRPALVALHHQPLPIGSRWLDTMQIDNGQSLIALAERYDNLKVMLWGHVHQAFDRQRGRTRFLATPSTCSQFLPESDDFAEDQRPPGYRWLELEPDGDLRTGIERLSEGPFPPDSR